VNSEYKHLIVKASPKRWPQAGQFFNILVHHPMMATLAAAASERLSHRPRTGISSSSTKCAGRGTKGMATSAAGGDCNMVGPLGSVSRSPPGWKNIVVLGRGVGLATMGPISRSAAENGSVSPPSFPPARRIW
jgi:dihydroorotate dehydrogenase electron transfer subunit